MVYQKVRRQEACLNMAAIWSLAEYLQMRRERDLILEILKRKAVAPQVFSESEVHTLLSDMYFVCFRL
ncbi:hypothetical protein DY000_02053991 [Brassica cretica]|uniref:Uncharacterized protein n=1 Tax=Brassica cretica TaxID=69181 RepID=A0ABQ7A9Z5_BRACR|nr:hypothetical protein DY000_02053991 [Brassica cretica]